MDFESQGESFYMQDCEPREWFVVFHRDSTRPVFNFLAWGRFKHVSAFGQVPITGDWVFYDFLTARMRVLVVPDDKSNVFLAHFANMGTILRMPAPNIEDERIRLKPGYWCVPAVAHLLGLSTCALRPDTLFRHCLANGGVIVVDDEDETQGRSSAQATAGAS